MSQICEPILNQSATTCPKLHLTIECAQNESGNYEEQTKYMPVANVDPGDLLRLLALPCSEQQSLKLNFRFLRNLAINKLQCDIFRKLHIIFNSNSCDVGDMHSPRKVPNRLYSWTLKDFTERRKLNNIWLDVLKKEIQPDCLQILKLKDDLMELLRYLNSLFNGLTGEDKFLSIKTNVISPINEASKFLSIHVTLAQELEANRIALRANIAKQQVLSVSKRDPAQDALKLKLEDKLMNNDVWDPIEVRYQLRHYRSKVSQMQYRVENEEDKMEEAIKNFLQMQQTESYCSQCILNMYYAQIENFKNRITDYNTVYDKEYERIDNKISYKKLYLDKIREQRKFCIEQMQRFREELEHLRQTEIAEKEAEAQRLLDELEAVEAARAAKKKNKLDKKNKSPK